MTTHFISAEVPLEDSALELHQAIATELEQFGEPLRWAITEIKDEIAHVEAVVTTEAEPIPAV